MVAINDFCWSAFLTKSALFLKFAPPGKKNSGAPGDNILTCLQSDRSLIRYLVYLDSRCTFAETSNPVNNNIKLSIAITFDQTKRKCYLYEGLVLL